MIMKSIMKDMHTSNFSLRIAVALKFEDGKDRLTRSTFCGHSNHGVVSMTKRLARIAFRLFVRSSCVRCMSGSFGFVAATDRDRMSWNRNKLVLQGWNTASNNRLQRDHEFTVV